MTNWKEIHPRFNEELEREWRKLGFNYYTCSKWIEVGLQPEDAKFVDYLEENDYSAEDVSNNVNIEILKENYQKSLSSQVNQNNFGFTFENSNTLSAEALVDLELHSATWQPTFEKIKDFDIANFPNFTPKQKDLLLEVWGSPKSPKIDLREFKENLKRAHIKFDELSREFNENLWKDLGFTSKQYQEWLDVGVQDHAFASWLRDIKQADAKWVLSCGNIENFRKEYDEYCVNLKLSDEVIKEISQKNFKHSWDYREKLTPEQQLLVNELIPNDKLRNRYKLFGLCQECYQPKTWYEWCRSCNYKRLQNSNWTSNNTEIDEFIRGTQLKALTHFQLLEWIPYEQFSNIEFVAEGGFGKVYKAKWIDGGQIEKWNTKDKKWVRTKNYELGYETNYKVVALKVLHDSQDIFANFLQEITSHSLFGNDNTFSGIVSCFGISQDLVTKDYIMVTEYMLQGNLRQYLQHNYNKLSFENKFSILPSIAEGLNEIHKRGLVHRDFHPGNILKSGNRHFITDLGQCKPINKTTNDKEIYGVLPYVAPEVLLGNPYTQASDIYSFGIIAAEIITGLLPYSVYDKELDSYKEMPHNANLVLEICGGLRPNLDTELAPEPLKDLIKRCWNADPLKRPKASELNKTLNNWQHGFDEKKGNVEFARQRKKIKIIEQCYTILLGKELIETWWFETHFLNFCQESGYHEETEEVHKMVKKLLAANNKPGYQIYPREVYHSKFIDTEKINKLLQSSKEENKEQLRYFDNFDDLGLAVSFEELDIIGNEKEKTEQQQSSLQAQIQIPPKSN